MALQRIGMVLAGVALAACSTVGPTVGPAAAPPACCAATAELNYPPLAAGTTLRVDIGPNSPVLALDGGRSPVAAFRLPQTRPLMLDLVSHQVSGPGAVGSMFAPLTRPTAMAFNPTVLILDQQFKLRRTVSAEGATASCSLAHLSGSGPVVQMRVPVSEPAAEAAYLVIATTDAQRGPSSRPFCKDVQLVHGDLGRIELSLQALEPDAGAILLAAPAGWYGGRWEGLWSGMAIVGRDPNGGRLVLAEQRLVYYRDQGGRLQPQFEIPVGQIVRVDAPRTRMPTLSVAALDTPGGTMRWHTFIFPTPTRVPDASADDFQRALGERIREDLVVETVGFAVPAWPAELGFGVTVVGGGGTPSRIGQDAMTAGIVTALPCGLCAAGGCPPEVLAPCAALFSVGAVVGGVWSAARELLTGGLQRKDAPAGAANAPDARQAAAAPVTEGTRRFDRAALQRCVTDVLAAQDGTTWRDSGRTARFRPLDPRPSIGEGGSYADLAAAGVRRVVETKLDGLALVAAVLRQGDLPVAGASATLTVRGTLSLVDVASGKVVTAPLRWTGEPRTLAEWAEVPAVDVAAELDRACTSIAADAVRQARQRWSASP